MEQSHPDVRVLAPIEPADSIAARRLRALQEYATARDQANALTVRALREPAPAADEAEKAAWSRVQTLVDTVKAIDSGKR